MTENLYSQVGELISGKVQAAEWGKAVFEQLAKYCQRTFPEQRGFSASNLWRMRQFFETYCDPTILATHLRELSWFHNL